MKVWVLGAIVLCAALSHYPGVLVIAQEVWSAIGNGGDTNSIEEFHDDVNKETYHYSWSDTNALTRSTLLDRQERLQFRCDQVETTEGPFPENRDPEAFRNILVDDNHQLLYCYVPKVACTNWKRVLMIAMGKWRKDSSSALEIPADLAHAPNTFRRLSNYTPSEIRARLASHDKLIVVRHPLERLLSAYRNKFEAKHERSSAYFQSRFGRKIIKKYRANPSEESLLRGDDVTFSEFVNFVTDDNENGTRNEHWNSISELCHPCLVNYNFISKYETLTEDAMEILERIGEGSIAFPMRPQNSEPTTKILDNYYSTLKYSQLRDLAQLYRWDFFFFDYSLEQLLGFSIA
ncbi:carbohydrate sulfotransferase 11 [Copidosoma floridanum]|uniref:carbohydrate sulfotransferase 11 n=1 Tax=Copidosoma floridanum TaxID=29053 RepID=UPI0006C9A021|nr:carbohydrate sulfotransferase 11 [Copidosoma floridanum]